MSLRLARRRITAYTDSNRAIPLLIRQVLPREANAVELFCCKRLCKKRVPNNSRAPIARGNGNTFHFITLTFSELAPIAAQENMSCYRFKTPPGFEPINQSSTLLLIKRSSSVIVPIKLL